MPARFFHNLPNYDLPQMHFSEGECDFSLRPAQMTPDGKVIFSINATRLIRVTSSPVQPPLMSSPQRTMDWVAEQMRALFEQAKKELGVQE